jgi:peptidoglycan hydrolase CwlO-like protein
MEAQVELLNEKIDKLNNKIKELEGELAKAQQSGDE